MKLFLASRLNTQQTREKLNKFACGLKGKKIAYIPTAANGENGWESWKNDDEDRTWGYINSLGATVYPIILEDYRSDSVIKDLENKDIILFSGGMPGYLMYWIRRCKIDLYLKDILKKGTMFVGTSAGAMVMGKTLQVASWSFVDGERGAENIEPIKLVNFDIFPHYQESFLTNIKKKYKGNKLYLLKDGEEIIVEDGRVQVIGEERIIENK
jgi:peptidase E